MSIVTTNNSFPQDKSKLRFGGHIAPLPPVPQDPQRHTHWVHSVDPQTYKKMLFGVGWWGTQKHCRLVKTRTSSDSELPVESEVAIAPSDSDQPGESENLALHIVEEELDLPPDEGNDSEGTLESQECADYLIQQKVELDKLVALGAEFLAHGFTLSGKRGTAHKGKAVSYLRVDDMRFDIESPPWRKSGYLLHVELNKPHGKGTPHLVCIDVDSLEVWERLVSPENVGLLGNPVIQNSEHGGHLLYKSAGAAGKSQLGKVLRAGFRADFLTNSVVLVGPHKSLHPASNTNLDELPELPSFMLPTSHKASARDLCDPKSGESGEGTIMRNNTLFNFLKMIPAPDEELLAAGRFINQVDFDPPLPDEEVMSVVKSIKPLEGPGDKVPVSESNTQVAFTLKNDREVLRAQLDGKIKFDHDSDSWYFWNGKNWAIYLESQMLEVVENAILDVPKLIKTKLSTQNTYQYANRFMNHLKFKLTLDPKIKGSCRAISFENGILDLLTGELCDHNPHFFVTTTIPYSYNPKEGLTYSNQAYLEAALGNDPFALVLFRSLLSRAIRPQPELQTGYLLFGEPGCGKSTWVEFLLEMLGVNGIVATGKDICDKFTRREIHNKSLLALPEISGLQKEAEEFMKMYLGRDKIPAQKKFYQRQYSEVFQGVVVATSNSTPGSLLGHSRALLDRFLNIQMHKIVGQRDEKTSQKLIDNCSGLINWGLSFPAEEMKALLRSGAINNELIAETQVIVEFLQQKCFFHPKAYVTQVDILDSYNEYSEEVEQAKPLNKSEFKAMIEVTLKDQFHFKLVDRLPKGDRGVEMSAPDSEGNQTELTLIKYGKLNFRDAKGKIVRPYGFERLGLVEQNESLPAGSRDFNLVETKEVNQKEIP